tara:strand:+ start:67 stop:702 length:636 start_codon:yes stop_codon:yes gene_type:complete
MKDERIKDYVFSTALPSDVRGFIEQHHYSASINGCKITQCYALHKDGVLIGALLFGALSTTAWKRYGDSEKDVIELRRLCLLDKCAKNTATWFVSRALKAIRKNHGFKVCISYADPYHGHAGYVYQAGNWSYLGTTSPDVLLKTPQGKLYHSRAMRTKYKGRFKPFALRLQALQLAGELTEVKVPGKHVYSYRLDGINKPSSTPYPKLNVL